MSPSYYEPNLWSVFVLKKEGEPPIFRTLASWRQTYLSGEEWRASSPIKCIELNGERVVIRAESGSTYSSFISSYGTSGYAQGAFEDLRAEARKTGIVVEAISLDEVMTGALVKVINKTPKP